MQPINLPTDEIQNLQEGADELLGNRVMLEKLHIPSNEYAPSRTLDTKGDIALAASSIEFFSHLQPETKYHHRFHHDERGNLLHREQGEIFAFQTQGGAPTLSVVLSDHCDAIAVIKRLMTHEGEELSWSALLQKLDVDPSQFKAFVDIADGIQSTRRNAQIKLGKIFSIVSDMHEVTMHPNPAVDNLHALFRLNREGREKLRKVLPNLLDQ